ncbi:hypothetical protein LF95_12270 [Thalassospira sp. TSL5-1]|nr:hypothetical protein LF95_12270 [Thalassospira sp. TSL5-1]
MTEVRNITCLSQTEVISRLKQNDISYNDFTQHFPSTGVEADCFCISSPGSSCIFVLLYYYKSHQIGYWMAPKYRGKGFGRDFLKMTFKQAIHKHDPSYVLALIHAGNTASDKIISACHFKVMSNLPRQKLYVWCRP